MAKKTTKASEASTSETNAFQKFSEKFGEGTAWDLDWGKLVILGLCVYIAIQVS